MRCLIRNVTRRGRDGVVHQDREVVADRLTIGRKPDAHLFLGDLRVAHEHATLAPQGDGRFVVVASPRLVIRIEREICSTATVGVGDRFSIGGFDLTLVDPPAGFDLQLDVEQAAVARGRELEDALRARSVMSIADTGLSRRRWSWGLFAAVFVLCGALPVAGFYAEPLRAVLRMAPLTGDDAWNPGPIATAHRSFGEDCNTCHDKPFVQVRDTACTACHKNTPDHVDHASPAAASAAAVRCASCHREHKGPEVFTRHDERLCTQCHRASAALARKDELASVSGFGDAHPEFRASMLIADGASTRVERIALDSPGGLKEHSNLVFPHHAHLDARGVKTASGERRVLGCGACHTPESSGLRMAPVSFQVHCHDCHRLRFATEAPQREVAHARPGAVLPTIEEYYAMRALGGGYEAEGAPEVVRRLRRPGESLTPAERRSAMDWVARVSTRAAGEVFQYSVCGTCHEVTRTERGDGGASMPDWEVAPVRVAASWLPKARFSHRKHSTMECADCHDAQASKSSEDVLIPGIASCRECHGGERAGDRVASSCVDCHGFHVKGDFMASDTGAVLPASGPGRGAGPSAVRK